MCAALASCISEIREFCEWVIGLALNNFSKYVAFRLIIIQSDDDKIDMYRHWGFVPTDEFEIRG